MVNKVHKANCAGNTNTDTVASGIEAATVLTVLTVITRCNTETKTRHNSYLLVHMSSLESVQESVQGSVHQQQRVEKSVRGSVHQQHRVEKSVPGSLHQQQRVEKSVHQQQGCVKKRLQGSVKKRLQGSVKKRVQRALQGSVKGLVASNRR